MDKLIGLVPFLRPALPGDENRNAPKSLVTASEISSALELLAAVPKPSEELIDRAYDEERREYLEPLENIRKKSVEVANLLRTSKHTVVYSGAGISTSSGIGDFRGPQGLWTCQDKVF